MCKFKVGDKVKRVGEDNGEVKKGHIYTVSFVSPYTGDIYVERLDGQWDSHKFELAPAITKTQPHKHAALIKAWADGAKIQHLDGISSTGPLKWEDTDMPNWLPNGAYRIKPEVKPDVVKYVNTFSSTQSPWIGMERNSLDDTVKEHREACTYRGSIKMVFDGETGKLKKAEVI